MFRSSNDYVIRYWSENSHAHEMGHTTLANVVGNSFHSLSPKSNLFWTRVFLEYVCGVTPNHIPLKYRYLIRKSNWRRLVHLVGMFQTRIWVNLNIHIYFGLTDVVYVHFDCTLWWLWHIRVLNVNCIFCCTCRQVLVAYALCYLWRIDT